MKPVQFFCLAFATLDLEQLDGLADRHGTPISIPPRGEVHQLARSANTRPVRIGLRALAHADRSLPDQLDRQCDDAARSFVLAPSGHRVELMAAPPEPSS